MSAESPKNHLLFAGHFTHDLPEKEGDEHRLGGAVSFGAVVAARQGVDVTVVTKGASQGPIFDKLVQLSQDPNAPFQVINLSQCGGLESGNTTTFHNAYVRGDRTQHQPEAAEGLDAQDARRIASLVKPGQKTSLIIATVSQGEVNEEFLQTIGQAKNDIGFQTVMLPQGLVRAVHPDSKMVTHNADALPWKYNPGLLVYAIGQLILSEEDLQGMPPGYEDYLRTSVSNLVVTRGGNGGTLYQNGVRTDVGAFALTGDELQNAVWTGSGDTVGTMTVLGQLSGLSPVDAFNHAQLFTAVKISSGARGKTDGLASVPTPEEYQNFLNENALRVEEFWRNANI